MHHVKQIHAHTLRLGVDHTHNLVLKLLAAAPDPGLSYAIALLDSSPSPTAFLYNKVLQALASRGQLPSCLALFSAMRRKDHHPSPNPHTFTFLLSACAQSSSERAGRALHAILVKLGFPPDAHLSTSLLHVYANSGLVDAARQLFDELPQKDPPTWNSLIAGYTKAGDLSGAEEVFEAMPDKNVITWTTMVCGYTQSGRYEKALDVFKRMWAEEKARPNEVTLASILPACANLGAMEMGEKIERYARENGLFGNVFVGNALVEMYGKCGCIEAARRVFNEMGGKRNVCSWNSMIMGLAVNGRWKESLELFNELMETGFIPDDITFVGLLMACTHGGLVDKGRHFFRTMEEEFSLAPKLEHYGCMVDLLGRAGRLSEAYDLIKSMPMKADSVIWGALLGACSFHGEVELAEIAVEFLSELEPWNPGNHVILSNIYASSGRWDGVAKEWKLIKGQQQRKAAGYSIVELDGRMHKFLVDDKSHPKCEEIYSILHKVFLAMELLRLDLQIEI